MSQTAIGLLFAFGFGVTLAACGISVLEKPIQFITIFTYYMVAVATISNTI